MLKRISFYAFSTFLIAACSNQEIVTHQETVSEQNKVNNSYYQNNNDPIVQKVAMVNFDFDSSKIHAHEMANIEQTLTALKNMVGNKKILVKGHTDILGSKEYNYQLGLERAQEIKNTLIINGVPAKDIYVMSFGENKPLINANDTDERYINRRATIEMIVQPNSSKNISMN
jgi:peptidoglycan-associated lipoprotein